MRKFAAFVNPQYPPGKISIATKSESAHYTPRPTRLGLPKRISRWNWGLGVEPFKIYLMQTKRF